MTSFRLRQPWAPWWIAAPMLIAYLGFGWLLFKDIGRPNEAVRIMIPPFVLLGALVIPAALNARYLTVDQNGIRLTNLPFPKGKNWRLDRDEIFSCVVRLQTTTFHFESGASSGDVENYLVGVDTRQGPVNLAYPYLKQEQAAAVARQIADALNADKTRRYIPVTTGHHDTSQPSNWRIKVLIWGGLFIAAIIGGAFWELA